MCTDLIKEVLSCNCKTPEPLCSFYSPSNLILHRGEDDEENPEELIEEADKNFWFTIEQEKIGIEKKEKEAED